MIDWDKLLASGVVRKTVALHPIWDQYVRNTQAIILQEGIDASYSLALNYMLLMATNLVINRGIDEKTNNMMSSFLEDQKTLENLNFSDLTIKYEEALKEKYINHNK